MTKRRENKKLLFTLLILIMLVMSVMGGRFILPAFAATNNNYSNALTDLQKDESFKISSYPDKPKDYSLNVIQIAESVDGELFVYTYQPCQKTLYLIATEINMSLSASADGTRLYELTLLNSSGVFCKYKVEGVTVSSAKTRYYNISTIYRDYDKIADDDALKNEHGIAFEVGQCWSAVTADNTVYYAYETVDTVTITNCAYGTVRIPEGFNFAFSYSCDMHIIAFSTDVKIDNLLEADVAFKYSYIEKGIYGQDTGVDWKDKTVTVNYKEKGTTDDHIFGEGKRTWDKIQSVNEFINTCKNSKIDLPDNVLNDIRKNKWVLAFWETDYENIAGGVLGWLNYIGAIFGGTIYKSTIVTDATVLRLEFIRDGVTYNLGTVMNKSGDFEVIGGGDITFADKIGKFFDNIWNKIKSFFGNLSWWQWLLIGLAAILCVGLIVSLVMFGIKAVIKFIAKLIWQLLCLPFKALSAIFRGKGKK